MSRKKSNNTQSLRDFSAAIKEVLDEIESETFAAVDRGLDKAMDYLCDKLEQNTPVQNTPVKSGLTRGSWIKTDKYKNVRYLNNTRTTGYRDVKDPDARTKNMGRGGIPVVNLLEFGSKGKPFVRATVEREKEQVINIIKGEVENASTE